MEGEEEGHEQTQQLEERLGHPKQGQVVLNVAADSDPRTFGTCT